MNKYQQYVCKAKVSDIEGAWIIISAHQKDPDKTYGEFRCEAGMSFLYDAGNGIAVEWEPEHGPIQRWHRAESGKEHYYFDYVGLDDYMSWSQLAVERHKLPQAFVAGNYTYIFKVLREWADE